MLKGRFVAITVNLTRHIPTTASFLVDRLVRASLQEGLSFAARSNPRQRFKPMQLAIVLAIVFAFVVSHNTPETTVEHATMKLAISMFTGVALVLLLEVITRRQSAQFRDRVHASSLIGFCIVVYGFSDFARIARFNWQLDDLILIDQFVLLLPIIAFVMASWAVLVRSWSPDARLGARIRHKFVTVFSLARHQLLLPVLPVLTVLAVAETTQLFKSSIPNLDGFLAGLALLVLIVMTPWVLRLIWCTEPLPPGNERRHIEQIFRQQNLRISDILIWRTDLRIVNALLAGLTPICRYLFLSDGLMDRVPGEKLTAIVAHEAGHLKYRHLVRLFLSLQIPFSLLMVTQLILNRAEISTEFVGICSTFGILLGWLTIHTLISRLLEHQADVAACYTLAGKQRLDESAVDAFSEALTCATRDCSGSDWLHPSPVNRIAMLRYLARDARRETHFHGQIQRVTRLLLVATIAIATCWIALLFFSAT